MSDLPDQVFRDHFHRVYRVALSMSGSHADAEDITQEAFVAIIRALPRFRGDSKLSTWIYRITLRVGTRWLAKRSVAAELPPNLIAEDDAIPIDLINALNRLPIDLRMVIQLVAWGFDQRSDRDAHLLRYEVSKELAISDRFPGSTLDIWNEDIAHLLPRGSAVVFLLEMESFIREGSRLPTVLTNGRRRKVVTVARRDCRQRGIRAEIVFVGGEYKKQSEHFFGGDNPTTHFSDFEVWLSNDYDNMITESGRFTEASPGESPGRTN